MPLEPIPAAVADDVALARPGDRFFPHRKRQLPRAVDHPHHAALRLAHRHPRIVRIHPLAHREVDRLAAVRPPRRRVIERDGVGLELRVTPVGERALGAIRVSHRRQPSVDVAVVEVLAVGQVDPFHDVLIVHPKTPHRIRRVSECRRPAVGVGHRSLDPQLQQIEAGNRRGADRVEVGNRQLVAVAVGLLDQPSGPLALGRVGRKHLETPDPPVTERHLSRRRQRLIRRQRPRSLVQSQGDAVLRVGAVDAVKAIADGLLEVGVRALGVEVEHPCPGRAGDRVTRRVQQKRDVDAQPHALPKRRHPVGPPPLPGLVDTRQLQFGQPPDRRVAAAAAGAAGGPRSRLVILSEVEVVA